jgi:hypothetical protein
MMEKDLHEVIVEQDAHHRLLCAIGGQPYAPPAERTKVATLAAALRGETYVALPAGVHQRLAEALGAGGPALPDGVHARLARALQG